MTELSTEFGLIQMDNLPIQALSADALASCLAKINRFAGRTPEPYSVARHSVLVARLCSNLEANALGLLHDGHEAFLGDIITPAVQFSASQIGVLADAVGQAIDMAKDVIDAQILPAWGMIDLFHEIKEEVAHWDRVACAAEMLVFFGHHPADVPTDDVDRAIEMLRGMLPASGWRSDADLWISEAQTFAKHGALRLP